MNDTKLIGKAKKIIEETPLTSDDWKIGACCRFIKVNEVWGVKAYEEKPVREYTWNLQNIAYKNVEWEKEYLCKKLSRTTIITNSHKDSFKGPLAPKAGKWIDSKNGYGYLTQIADTKPLQLKSDIETLKNRLDKIGINAPYDDFKRKENLGHIDKNLVCIDFDAFTIKIITHGGLLQYHIARPSDNIFEIPEELKEILKWKTR
jgi:hypothetical protein